MDSDEGRIENLKRKMYSREVEGLSGTRRHNLAPSLGEVKTDWGEVKYQSAPPFVQEKKRSMLSKFLWFSLLFFVVASAYAGYLFFGGSNVVSSQNIDIEVLGPVSIKGGETLSLDISVINRNATPLEVVDLILEYPEGTRNPSDLSKELPRERISLGDINPGDLSQKTMKSVLFGEERSIKDIKITVEYRVPASNAIFYKESVYQVVVSSSPLTLVVDAPKEANSGQDVSIRLTVNSNSPDIIKNVVLIAEYPSGFSFSSSDPKTLDENRIWKLGDVSPGSKRTFTIRGTLSGENSDIRVFRFQIGVASQNDEKKIATPFMSISEEISLNKPFIGLSLLANGLKDEIITVKSGRPVRVNVSYTNNLLVPVSSVEISLLLSGDAIDEQSVSVERGFYRSIDDTVIWNRTTFDRLNSISPGESGSVSFTFSPRSLSQGIATIKNPEIIISGSVKGRRDESGRVPEEVVATVKKQIRVETDVGLNARALYGSGPFTNTGGLPPKAEKETTYTVVWTITNGSNDLGDVRVSAQLPSYIRFIKGDLSSQVTYDESSGVVIWNAGLIPAGSGFGSSPKEVAFQIGFIPSTSQIGQNPVLINDATLSAVDRFTNSNISLTKPFLDTRISSDSTTKSSDYTVVK